MSIGFPESYDATPFCADLQFADDHKACVITSSGIATVKDHSTVPAKFSPHVPELRVPD